jgi:hypothetical protein
VRTAILIRTYSARIVLVLVLLAFASNTSGQDSDSTAEFWPEINIFINLNEKSRIFILGTATKQENLGKYADGQSGVYFDFWAFPALRARLLGHADASRSKSLLLRTGYLLSRPKNNSGAVTEHMLSSEATGRAHLPASILLSDRNRIDLRWLNGDFRKRYRNRLKLERTFHTERFEFTPYAHAEVFYDLNQSGWTRLRYAAGMEWSVTRRLVLEGYFVRQNDWGSVPQFVDATGIVVQFYFR